MNCAEQREHANAFVDGELEARHQAEFFRHLGECPDCRSFMEIVTRMREAERREQITYPPELDGAILSNLMRMRSHKAGTVRMRFPQTSVWTRRLEISAPVIAAAAIVLIVFGFSVSLWVRRAAETSVIPVTTGYYSDQLPVRPAKIIVIYSLPPVEVHGTLPAEPAVDRRQVEF